MRCIRSNMQWLRLSFMAFLGCYCLLAAQKVLAGEKPEQKPLWEAGIVGGGGWVPDYPAADEGHFHGIAAPYIIYRGKHLRAGDGKGIVRGRYAPSERLEFDISVSGSFPADSSDNNARQGMPDLDYLAEAGPRMQLNLVTFSNGTKIDLELPVRAIFSTDFSDIHYRGVVFQPELALQHDDLWNTATRVKVSAGPIFATEKFMDYIYGVDKRYATAERPRFNADGGYMGSKLKFALVKEFNRRIKVFGIVNVGYYDNAANEGSPLHRDDLNIGAGFGLAWSFRQSEQMVAEGAQGN